MKINYVKLLQIFCKIFCSNSSIFKFKITSQISGNEFKQLLQDAFPTLKTLKIADNIYHIFKWTELKDWLNKDSLSEMRWIEDINDCDDFAMESTCRIKRVGRMQSKNLAYGIGWGATPMGYHAFCVACIISKNDDKKIIIIEPQNDDTREWQKSDYKPDFIKI